MAAATGSSIPEIKQTVMEYLRSKHVQPNARWLANFASGIRPNTPIPALLQTALFRILSSDLTESLQPAASSIMPADISSPEIKERRLVGPLTVQVLDVEDIGHSRWSQVESIEAQERGEMTKGREVIRVVADEENNQSGAGATDMSSANSGPHKLLLQDVAGTKVYAFESSPISNVNCKQLPLGAKLVLRDVAVARGVALLTAANVEVLGGKVDAWDKKWRGERKEMLMRQAGMGDEVDQML